MWQSIIGGAKPGMFTKWSTRVPKKYGSAAFGNGPAGCQDGLAGS